jgi:hypothetical protein
MGFRIENNEQFTDGLDRIMQEQAAKILTGLKITHNRHAGIHEARKRLKKARAVIRLVRPNFARRCIKN